MIRKRGKQWILMTRDGSRRLGVHSSRASAERQEAAIEIAKHSRGDAAQDLVKLRALLKKKKRQVAFPPPKKFDNEEKFYRGQLNAILDFVHAEFLRKWPKLKELQERRGDAFEEDAKIHTGNLFYSTAHESGFQDVNLESLIATQPLVSQKIVQRYIDDPVSRLESNDPVRVLSIGGKLYLQNGHHRVAAAILRGEKTINASVGRFDSSDGLPFHVRFDDWTDEIDEIFQELRRAADVAAAQGPRIAKSVATKTDLKNQENFRRTMKEALSVDIFENAPDVAASVSFFIQENASLITSIPTRYLDEVEGIVLRNFRSGTRAEDFEDELVDRYDVSKSRAALIARDQVSKLNGALTKDRQENAGIKFYFWRTSRDERVRDTHRENEGERFSWDEPPEETGHPGEDFNCRCHADPDVDELLGEDTSADDEEGDEVVE